MVMKLMTLPTDMIFTILHNGTSGDDDGDDDNDSVHDEYDHADDDVKDVLWLLQVPCPRLRV